MIFVFIIIFIFILLQESGVSNGAVAYAPAFHGLYLSQVSADDEDDDDDDD
jgi:hypothetical protein